MIRKIIQIDEEKCNGCGACAEACHEGAIGIVNGKAKLLRDDYCDGLGDCLPTCPTGAISFVEREAAAYDEKAVQEIMRKKNGQDSFSAPMGERSQLGQWPCQIKLVPINAPWFDGARLLIAADCSAYAYARMHGDFMRGKITLIGCHNNIQSVTIVRMEVPCCGGLESAAKRALQASGRSIPCEVATISVDGKILG